MADETIGQRLRRLRLAAGLSQRDISSPGVSYAYISRIEAGTRHPSVKALRKLAPELGVSVHYLETGEPDPVERQQELIRSLFEDRREKQRLIRSLRRELRGLRHPEEMQTLDRDLLEAIREQANRVAEKEMMPS